MYIYPQLLDLKDIIWHKVRETETQTERKRERERGRDRWRGRHVEPNLP